MCRLARGDTMVTFQPSYLHRIGRRLFLCMFVFEIAACDAAKAISPSLVDHITWLEALGYRVIEPLETFHLSHPDWEAVHLESKSMVGLKSTFPVRAGDPYYYRFTLVEEVFTDEPAARTRLEVMRLPPDGILPSQRKSYALRRGFRDGRTVYSIHTDAVMFEKELVLLGSVLKQLHFSETSEDRQRILQKIRAVRSVQAPFHVPTAVDSEVRSVPRLDISHIRTSFIYYNFNEKYRNRQQCREILDALLFTGSATFRSCMF